MNIIRDLGFRSACAHGHHLWGKNYIKERVNFNILFLFNPHQRKFLLIFIKRGKWRGKERRENENEREKH